MILPPGSLPLERWGRGVDFPTVTLLEMGAILPLKTLPLGGGMELIFLNLFHMRDTHNDFQLPSTKTEIVVKLGQFNPPETLPWGRGDRGREVKFPRSPSYERHTYQFSASYLQDLSYL